MYLSWIVVAVTVVSNNSSDGADHRSSSPPLRIHHLMAWMAVTAALIFGSMWFDRTARNGPPIEDRLVVTGLVLLAIAASAAITFGGFAVHWRDHGVRFPQHPGDFLIMHAAKCLVFFVIAFVGIFVVFLVTGGDDFLDGYYVLVASLAFITWMRAAARGYAQYADTTAWRIAFWLLIVTPGLIFIVWYIAGRQMILPVAIVVACLLFAMFDDARSGRQRSWTHWIGCFTTMTFGLALAAVFHH